MKPKYRMLGIISGIGSMMVPALKRDDIEVVGNYEWRKYYNSGTFEKNFKVPLWNSWGDVPAEAKEDIDIVMSHPECFTNPMTPVYTSVGWKPIGEIQEDDLVLTHKGRFRKVIKTFRRTSEIPPKCIRFGTSTKTTNQKALTITEDHPLLIQERGWISAKNLKTGDRIIKLSKKCKGCNGAMDWYMDDFQYKGFCSISCSTKNQWKISTEEEKKKLVEKAHERTRERVAEGVHQFTDPNVRSKGAKVLGKRAYGKTWLEERFGWMLNEIGIETESQHPIDKYFVDFAIPDKRIAIEVDGEYWHRDETREKERQGIIESHGWQVLRFSETRINKDLFGCGKEIQRIANNHDGKYGFYSEEILWIEKKIAKKNLPLINLGVEEDNSYIAKGFVVHNCGNFSILQKDLSKRSEENDIREFIEHIAEIKPKFFLMDNLYPSLAVYPASFYQEMLPEYDVFFEFVSNYHYGNVQKNRKRLFLVGALKELQFTFKPGEEEYRETVRDIIGDLPHYKDIPEINHLHIDPNEEAEGWHLPGKGKDAEEGERGYYTYGELAVRFLETSPGKGLEYLSKKTGTMKNRLGYFRFGWDQHGYVLHGGSPSRYHSHFHPETGMPLTVRERARIQGFPDDFIFVLPEDWAHLGVKQTGKAMPVEFCRFATEQFIAHLKGEDFEPSGRRFANIPPIVGEEKENYCKTQGYSDQPAACGVCWKANDCETRNKKTSETFFEF